MGLQRRSPTERPEEDAVGRSAGRFEAFDGLRAVAACMVLAYHAGMVTVAWRLNVLAPFAWLLKSGVTIFFLISGFLLYIPYARSIQSGSPLPDWRRFAGRRAVRVLPAFWVALTVVGLAPFAPDVFSTHWWKYYGLVQSYDRSTWFGGVGVAWTLCVEVAFYLSLPLFAWGVAKLARPRRKGDRAWVQLRLVAGLALAALALRFGLTSSLTASPPAHDLVLVSSLPALMDWFAIGLGLAIVVSEWELDPLRFRAIGAMVARPGACWLLAASLYVLAALAQPQDVILGQYGLLTHVAIGLAAGLFVLPAIRPVASGKRALPIRLLTHPHLAWVGTISYGIYLWHLPLLETIFGPINWDAAHPPSPAASIAGVALATAGAVALGAASWYLVERPAQRWLRNREAARLTLPELSAGEHCGDGGADARAVRGGAFETGVVGS